MKKIRITTAPGETKDSALHIRMKPKRWLKPVIDINIPFTLMFTDMFARGVLTPKDEQLFFTQDDDRALIAFHFINSETRGKAPYFATIQQIIAANLILASVAYKELSELTDTYIENVILEMKDGDPVADDIFFLEMIDKCTPKVNGFMRGPMMAITDADRNELYRSILKPYAKMAEHAEIRTSKVKYHPEVLNGDGATA